MDWIATIIVGILAMAGTLGGAYIANRKSSAVIAYKLETLEQKVASISAITERTYEIEKICGIRNERIEDIIRRVEALEKANIR